MRMELDSECVIAPGYGRVAEEFERNFQHRSELGAAFAAVVNGDLVLDLWGGIADQRLRRPWQRDTLQLIFSGTKGLVAICVLMLIEREALDLERPIAEYWPEFAAAGKGKVTVRQAVTHSASLPGLTEPVTYAELCDDRRMAERVAAQAQFPGQRARNCYHPLTFGWICGELVRRIDGRSIGRFFAEDVAGPLELDTYIGLPRQLGARVSRLQTAAGWPTDDALGPAGWDDDLARSVYGNPPLFPPTGTDPFPWNGSAFHAAEIAGAGGISTARSLATLYGRLDDVLQPGTLELGCTPLEQRVDGLLPPGETRLSVYGVGFSLQNDRVLGPPSDALGHGGAGGSVHGRWPSQDVGFSYAMNLMRDDCPDGDPRSQALLRALWECVGHRDQPAAGGFT